MAFHLWRGSTKSGTWIRATVTSVDDHLVAIEYPGGRQAWMWSHTSFASDLFAGDEVEICPSFGTAREVGTRPIEIDGMALRRQWMRNVAIMEIAPEPDRHGG
ncbi:hypothetical protein [Georgenia alba]|uniref:Uncharacterized protein n=1 Tax=Georgenia alba TaxID=2233858 RepID=A0ABW2Q871_9MICO